MNHNERWLGMLFFVALFLCTIGLWFGITPAHAQDAPSVCRDANDPTQFTFHIPASWNNPDIPTWWYLADTFWMVNDDPTTYHAVALSTWPDQIWETDDPQWKWEENIKNGQAIVGSGDYATVLVGDENTAVCDDIATMTPQPTPILLNGQVERIPATPEPVVSTGLVCVVKYPQIVVVCNG